MAVVDKILKLTRQLYPTGRAFKMPFDGVFEKMHKGLAQSEARVYNDAVSILNSALPDNDDFDEEDATDWERRLGLITNDLVPLADRRLAIIRKMNHPGTIPARSNFIFLEKQLQDAGFDVYVYENIFDDGMGGYITKTPEEVTGDIAPEFQLADAQLGDYQLGENIWDIIANYIDEELDRVFNVGLNLRSTFFIGGPYVGEYANVDEERREEFRQIILRTKPTHNVGYLFINYV